MPRNSTTSGVGIQADDTKNAVIGLDLMGQDGSDPCLTFHVSCGELILRVPPHSLRAVTDDEEVEDSSMPVSIRDYISEDEDLEGCIVWIVDRYGPMTKDRIWIALARHLYLPSDFSMVSSNLGSEFYEMVDDLLDSMLDDLSLEMDEFGKISVSLYTPVPNRWPGCCGQ